MSDTAQHVARFGAFELDLRAAELRREGRVVSLPRQQFIVLTTLVENPGSLVTRDQLRARLWGDDEHVDFDAGLNFCIRQLRLTLGDTADQPRFIQTVPRRGYRFVAPVTASDAQPHTPNARRARLLALATVATVVIAGAAVWSLGRGGPSATPETDARIADAHAARGFVALNDEWNWDVATRAFDRALQLDPAHEMSLISMSRLHASQGRFESALEFARRATEAHPSSSRARVTLGWTQLFAGDAAAARETCAAPDQPDTPAARMCRLQAEAATGIDLSSMWEQILSTMPADGGRGSFFTRATVEARLGRSADARLSLIRAIEGREPDAMFVFVHPALARLCSDPAVVQAASAAGLSQVDLR